MRDATFYLQLGFEHGYAGSAHSYPNESGYRDGYAAGWRFRHDVTGLAPQINVDLVSGETRVSFPNYDPMKVSMKGDS